MNRVMATRSVSLHDEHATTTRTRILDAVVELIVHEHPATLSIPAVAEHAGVSLRTVYRYFPNKEALLDAVGNFGDEAVNRVYPTDELHYADLEEYFTRLWPELESTRALMKAQQATPLGQEIAKQRAKRRRQGIDRILAEEGFDLEPDDHRKLAAIISLLLSRTTLFELTDVTGLIVDEAARVAVWATRAITEQARRTKEVGR